MESNLVSIIIPVYNRISLLSRALECSINQSYKNIEIIIGDNCSEDGTWELILEFAKKDSRIIAFRNIENLGPVRNWIECLKRANGEYIKFLFSDDWFPTDHLEIMVPYMKKNIAFVFCPARIVSNENNSETIFYKSYKKNTTIISSNFIKNSLINKNSVSPGNALFRKIDVESSLMIEIPNDKGLQFSKYGAGNDKLIFLLTAEKYKYSQYIDNTHVYFLGHKDSFSTTLKLSNYYYNSDLYFINQTKNKSIKRFYESYNEIRDRNYHSPKISLLGIIDTFLFICFNKIRKSNA